MKRDDIARVLNVSQSVVSRPLKEHYNQVRDSTSFLNQIAGIRLLLSTTIKYWYLSKVSLRTVSKT